MKTSNKHSILIPYGRRKDYLFKCLGAIRKQQIHSEIIVVDMYNDDLDLSKFQARYIALNHSEENFQRSVCLNRAVEHATGEYVSIIDCDMIVSPGWYKAILKKLHPTTVIVTPVFMQAAKPSQAFLADRMPLQEFISTSGEHKKGARSQITVLGKHLLRKPFREEYEGYGAEDDELNARLAKSFRFLHLNKTTPFYHVHHPRNLSTPYFERLAENRTIYREHLAGLQPRLGIYVAAYHSSRILHTHLAKIAKNTEMEFDYYIADNSKQPDEKERFAEIIKQYDFVTELHSPSSSHGDTLQYMVEQTTNEIIALFDVDAFPHKPWDHWALEKLQVKKLVGVLSYVASREIDYHLHPSFMVFQRSFLEQNDLDLRAGRLSTRNTNRQPGLDPAGKLTCFLKERNWFTPAHIEALLPTKVEVPFHEPFQWGGSEQLRRGFGVTYNDLIFHFWYGRNLYESLPIYDDEKRLVVSVELLDRIVQKYTEADKEIIDTNSDFSVGGDLVEAIRQLAPEKGVGLDLGAGNLVSAAALAEKCQQVFSLEEDKNRAILLLSSAAANIKVMYSPLKKGNYPYQNFGKLNAIVVDGPRGHRRQGVLAWLDDLEEEGLVFLDDTQRPQIRQLGKLIEQKGFQIIKESESSLHRTWTVLQKKKQPKALIALLMLSYNRSEYTRMTLESFYEVDCGIDHRDINFTVIDQTSTDDSVKQIEIFRGDHSDIIDHFIIGDQNRGAYGGFGYFVSHYSGLSPFICKIDNDSIFTPGWLSKLLESLKAFPELGVVGAQEQAVQGKNNQPVLNKAGIGYFPARFVGGRFLARREVFAKHKPGSVGTFGWAKFQQKLINDYHIGWCIPVSLIEHVGDWNFQHPKSIKNEKYVRYFKNTGRMRGA